MRSFDVEFPQRVVYAYFLRHPTKSITTMNRFTLALKNGL